MQSVYEKDGRRSQHLGEGEREPDSGGAGDLREYEEDVELQYLIFEKSNKVENEKKS